MNDLAEADPAVVHERLRVGFLHLGRDHSGLRRYGTILAAEARRHPDLWVREADAGGRDAGFGDLRRAAASLRDVDVVHVQWKLADWGVRSGGLPRLEVLRRSLPRPLVVTMHDVFPPGGRVARRISPAAIGLRRLGRLADRLVVHSEDERERLTGWVPSGRLAMVPHFVEVRGRLPDRATARGRLGLADQRVVTLLGAITKRRGHRLVLDALLDLPVDVVALFVGSVIEGRDHVARDLQAHALDIGVADRVRFLGYLPEDELEEVLAATDVALCPFRFMSASGALATWLSSGRPIVASDLAPVRELDALAPGALRRFSPYEAPALSAAIREALASAGDAPDARVQALAAQLATPRIVERYAVLYREATEAAAARHGSEATASDDDG
jgi:glycosyltransferase involved in cell wall biosynthesis